MKFKILLLAAVMATTLTNVYTVAPISHKTVVMASQEQVIDTFLNQFRGMTSSDQNTVANQLANAISNPSSAWSAIAPTLSGTGVTQAQFSAALTALEGKVTKEKLTNEKNSASVVLSALDSLYATTAIPDASQLPTILENNADAINKLFSNMSGANVVKNGTTFKFASDTEKDTVTTKIKSAGLSAADEAKALLALNAFAGSAGYDMGTYADAATAVLKGYGVNVTNYVAPVDINTGGTGGGTPTTPSATTTTTPPTTPTTTTTVAPAVQATVTADAAGNVKATADISAAALQSGVSKAVASETKTEVSKVTIEAKATALAVGKTAELAIPATVAKDIAQLGVQQVVVKIAGMEVALPSSVFASNAEVSLTTKAVAASDLPKQFAALAQDNTAKVYSFDLKVAGKNVTSSFNNLVQLAVEYKLPDGINPHSIGAAFLNEKTGALETRGGKYDNGKVSFNTSHFSSYVIKADSKTFSDLASAEWAREYIETMASKGVLLGRGDGRFDPKTNMSRAEIVTVAAGLIGAIDSEATCGDKFTDVKATDWFTDEIASLNNLGINMKGGTDTEFKPNEKVSRQDMMTLMASVLYNQGYKKVTNASEILANFTDADQIAEYAADDVALLVREGIISGKGDGILAPKANLTRAEASAAMYKFLDNVK